MDQVICVCGFCIGQYQPIFHYLLNEIKKQNPNKIIEARKLFEILKIPDCMACKTLLMSKNFMEVAR
jgi:hypothetical protein